MDQCVAEQQMIASLLTDNPKYTGCMSRGVQTDAPPVPGRESRVMTVAFSFIVISIFLLIGFSIWLSVEMGKVASRGWSSGKMTAIKKWLQGDGLQVR